jgi:hypothetical protein
MKANDESEKLWWFNVVIWSSVYHKDFVIHTVIKRMIHFNHEKNVNDLIKVFEFEENAFALSSYQFWEKKLRRWQNKMVKFIIVGDLFHIKISMAFKISMATKTGCISKSYILIFKVFHFKTDIYLQILDRPSRISSKLFLNFIRLFLRTL